MLRAKRPHLSILDWDTASRARLRAHAEKLGLSIACIAGYTNFTADLEHRDIPNREFQIRHVVELAEMARDLGCGLIRVFTGYEQRVGDSGRAVEDCCGIAAGMCERAARSASLSASRIITTSPAISRACTN